MAFEELKQKQSVVWGTGPYQNITDTITESDTPSTGETSST
jgi:hypothetical protein